MGVLDDAIREHLDLKRARGGDPAEIERMERDALGPVRREPTIGSTRFEDARRRESESFENDEFAPDYRADHLEDLEELQERGYHDSTAPHPHPDHPHAPHDHPDTRHEFDERHFRDDHEDVVDEPPEAAPEQPRRRFLRRNRGPSRSESTVPDPRFHEDDSGFDPYDPFDHSDQVEAHEPLGRDEPLHHRDPHEEHPVDADDETAVHQVPGSPTPPQLQFERPPKRPHFTAEPPSLPPSSNDEPGAQETTEFDVQRHIAETRHLPDEDVPAGEHTPAEADTHGDEDTRADQPARAGEEPSPAELDAPAESAHARDRGKDARANDQAAQAADEDAAADEDVLEETPEFLQDTPEHDRLWFEQRPPKDFDFDG